MFWLVVTSYLVIIHNNKLIISHSHLFVSSNENVFITAGTKGKWSIFYLDLILLVVKFKSDRLDEVCDGENLICISIKFLNKLIVTLIINIITALAYRWPNGNNMFSFSTRQFFNHFCPNL